MTSKEYIDDCREKIGVAKTLKLSAEQTTVLQGLLAGAVSSGKALSHLKKDVFEYNSMRVSKDLHVEEHVAPLNIDEDMHVALRAILGMHGELADVSENLYLWMKGDAELDIGKLIEDLGDMTFYASLLLHLVDQTWEELQTINKAKTDTKFK